MKIDSVTLEKDSMNNIENLCDNLIDDSYQIESVVLHRLEVAACFIEEDIKRGVLPDKISSFSDAHDYIDANMYLINEGCPDPKIGSFYEWDDWSVDKICEHFNMVIDALDKWLSQRRCYPVATYLKIST